MAELTMREALKALGWTQKHFAARTGYSEHSVSVWLAGKATPPKIVVEYLNVLLKLRGVLDGQDY
jgi:transcriptional regulator with XRE-family HTH domain